MPQSRAGETAFSKCAKSPVRHNPDCGIMSYRIEKGEGLAEALGRIAAEEMDVVRKELRRNRGESVHSARKAIKRLRALLRSLRVAFAKNLFQAENRCLGKAGRTISPLRDLEVQLRTLGKLRAARNPAGGKMRSDLLGRQKNFARKVPALRRAVRRMLGDSGLTIKSWPLDKTTPASLAAGLKRIYKQGRGAFCNARKNPTPDNLHEWRKKAKTLGFGFELIERMVPKEFLKRMKFCQTLGEVLGDDHDLFMVLQALRQANHAKRAGDYAELARRISAKRAKLRKRAFKLGKRIYGEKPRALARRLDWHLRNKIGES
jgi:CHAD domain-containing protein